MGAWDQEKAIKDLKRSAELDSALENTVEKELQAFSLVVKEKDQMQKEKLSKLFK